MSKVIEKTLCLEIIRRQPERFSWGTIVAIHEMGPYAIVASDDTFNRGPSEVTERHYHCYVNGENIGRSAISLDEALILCVAFGRLGEGTISDFMAKAALKLLTDTP
jgi:hypothetical protein